MLGDMLPDYWKLKWIPSETEQQRRVAMVCSDRCNAHQLLLDVRWHIALFRFGNSHLRQPKENHEGVLFPQPQRGDVTVEFLTDSEVTVERSSAARRSHSQASSGRGRS